MNTVNRRPATEKQFSFLRNLIAERAMDKDLAQWVNDSRTRATTGMMTSLEASKLIDALLDAPKKVVIVEAEEPEAGVYRDGKTYFRVYLGQQSGKMLAKRILFVTSTDVEYVSAGLAARVLSPMAARLSLEEVGKLGVATGSCLVCGRRLDDPESVDRGIGPVCASRY